MTEEAMPGAQAAAPKPLKLPKLFAPAAALYTALSAHGASTRLPIGGAPAGESKRVLLRIAPPSAAAANAGEEAKAPAAPGAALRFRAGDAHWTLFLEDFSLFSLHPIFEDPEMAASLPESLPDELLAALAEDLLKPALAVISDALGAALAFEGFVRDCAAAAARAPRLLTLSIAPERGEAQAEASDSAAFGAWLSADSPAAFQGLTAFLAQAKSGKGFLAGRIDSVPIEIALIGAEAKLGLVDCRGLASGDIVCLEDWAPARGEILAAAVSGARRICEARCRLEEGALTIDEPWRLAQSEAEAAPAKEAAAANTENTMQRTDDIEVTLSFELERRTITVGELKSLEPGAVLRLTADPEAPVTIRANGAPIAKGRLVDLNGVIGVQLTAAQGDGARHVD